MAPTANSPRLCLFSLSRRDGGRRRRCQITELTSWKPGHSTSPLFIPITATTAGPGLGTIKPIDHGHISLVQIKRTDSFLISDDMPMAPEASNLHTRKIPEPKSSRIPRKSTILLDDQMLVHVYVLPNAGISHCWPIMVDALGESQGLFQVVSQAFYPVDSLFISTSSLRDRKSPEGDRPAACTGRPSIAPRILTPPRRFHSLLLCIKIPLG
ncbi:hypothetical protein BS47DRAFT_1485931 [Hydnum rufescens UP504]|uniref:Uncharacterized protein n=1 Tax=Hydnum rufescens UP504 TaxID=1448309 RepID=A0A9P6AWX9_9AGAM|nr:hypothetical protein BS47DRAFT_1485931 [Hydnum rufescens UP504]